LKCRKEFGVDESRFGIFEFLGHVTSESEIRVLIDSTRDKTWDVGYLSIDLRERIGK
jgi:hypothetical protein